MVVDGQHPFMVRGSGYNMMKPTLGEDVSWKATPDRGRELYLFACPTKEGVDSVHT